MLNPESLPNPGEFDGEPLNINEDMDTDMMDIMSNM